MKSYAVFMFCIFVFQTTASAIAPGVLDDFETPASQDWSPSQAITYPSTGGPANDAFLQASSGAFGGFGNLAINNPTGARWHGNYTAAGVTTLEADLKVIGGGPLEMRVVLFGGSTIAESRVTSTVAMALPANGQWNHLTFSIAPADLTLVLNSPGTDTVASVLANVTRVMLRHQSGPPGPGGTPPPESARVGFDNILAGPVPLSIMQWRSVRTHSGAGNLPIVLSPSATGNGQAGPTVERRMGGIQRIEVDFSGPTSVSAGAVTVSGQTTVGGVAQPPVSYPPTSVSMVDANTAAILFNAGLLPNQTCYTIDISPTLVTGLTGDHDVKVRALVGDATSSGVVNLSDALATKAWVGQAVGSSAGFDINLSGGITIDDALAAKTAIGNRALCP